MTQFADWLLANTSLAVVILSGILSVLSGLAQVFRLERVSKIIGTIAVLDLGRIIRASARSIKARRIITDGSVVVLLTALVGCAATDRIAETCPVPAVRAAVAAGQTALAIVEAVCARQPTPECQTQVGAARATLEDAETTRRDVCAITPALRSVPCPECGAAIDRVEILACEGGG